jgi:outer membrane protein assembly factor BamB
MVRAAVALLACAGALTAADWSMGGRDGTRNPVSPEAGAPTDWQVRTDEDAPRNIRWSVRLGSRAIGGPVVAGGLVWVGTNNEEPLDPKIKGDRAVLVCFRESDGKFLYQHASPRLAEPLDFGDWPYQSQSGAPLIEGDRLWFKNNRAEVVCLDVGPVRTGTGPAREVWKVDLIKEYGVRPTAYMIPGPDTHGSPAGYKDYLYLHTGNGHGAGTSEGRGPPAPEAPSLVCLRKDTGKLVWKDASPDKDIRYGQSSSPLVVEVGSTVQAVVPEADGWVRAFAAITGKPLWRFDLNTADTATTSPGKATYGVATPVYAGGRMFVSLGRFPEACMGAGRLCCLDPTKRGDISAETRGPDGRREPNPNSGLVWEYRKPAAKDEPGMGLMLSPVAVAGGLVIAADANGCVHCIDAKSGRRHWVEDTRSNVFGPPLVAAGMVYVGNQDGTVTVLELAERKKVLARRELNQTMVAGPVFANETLYLLTEHRLFAVGSRK